VPDATGRSTQLTGASVRVALIGLGDIGISAHLPAILADERAELVAICDRDAAALGVTQAGLERDLTATTDAQAIFADDSVDAVIIATPPWVTHYLAPAALRAGKYVLAEKPIASCLADAAEFTALEPSARARLQVGFTYRHHPSIERARDLVQAGALGRPLLLRVTGYDGDATTGSALGELVLGHLAHGMPIVHEGAHFCDWASLILGAEPVEAMGQAVKTDPSFPAANLNVAMARYEDGSVALFEAGWLAPRLPANHFTITGALGHVSIELETLELTGIVRGEEIHVPGTPDRMGTCFALQLSRFLDAVQQGTAPVPGLEEGLACLALTDRLVAATVGA
jgi:myo-inositol 2-dehydrogenase/D-chiro-inositol 1-dehydrogenase